MLEEYFPFWKQITGEQREQFNRCAIKKNIKKGTTVYQGEDECIGILIVEKGQLRVFTISEEGKEITLYRLLPRDVCLLSASCVMRGIQFQVMVEAASDTQVIQIPAGVYRSMMDVSAPVANYTNELMAEKFSDVMWLMDQVLYKRLDSRIAAFLLEELEEGDSLSITHDQIARHLGSAREVVTRMLKYFQSEGLVALSRGTIRVLDRKKLEHLARESMR